MKNKRNYYGYRISTRTQEIIDFFAKEMEAGRLRQGWGFEENQDLNHFNGSDEAKRNFKIYENVKKGDILLVPEIIGKNKIAVVEATEDFNKGYKFEISEQKNAEGINDFGHIFPVKYIGYIKKEDIDKNIETAFTPHRFWNMENIKEKLENVDVVIKLKTVLTHI